jgi:hypothetical protein
VPPQPAAFEQMLTLMAGMEDDDEIDAMLTQVGGTGRTQTVMDYAERSVFV